MTTYTTLYTLILSLLLTVFIKPTHVCFGHCCMEDNIPIALRVIVQDINKKPIQDVLIVARTDEETLADITDEHGEINIEFKNLKPESRIELRPYAQGFVKDPGLKKEVRYAIDRFMSEYRNMYSFPKLVSVTVPQKEQSIELVISVKPAIQIKGRLIDQEGTVIDGLVHGPGFPSFTGASKKSGFNFKGAPQGEPFALYFSSVSINRVVEMIFSVEDTIRDIDAGDVQLKPPSQEVNIDVKWTDPGRLTGGKQIYGLTIVSRDGKDIYTYWGYRPDVNSNITRPTGDKGSFQSMPIGEFYIVPEVFMGQDFQTGLINAIKDGIDPAMYGVPMITITEESDKTSLTIDCGESRTALNKMLSDLAAKETGDCD